MAVAITLGVNNVKRYWSAQAYPHSDQGTWQRPEKVARLDPPLTFIRLSH
ncbi:MAG: hypothetical protein AB7O62_14610 [Pirellulales bacterium]